MMQPFLTRLSFLCEQGVNLNKIMGSTIIGPTLVDSVNHGWILNGKGVGNTGSNTDSPQVVNWNRCSYLKVLNWRGNGDGIHIFNFWHDVTDTYMRTQDGSMYFGTTMETYTTWRRIVLWNDANGVPFMLSGNQAVGGKGLGRMDQVDIIYQVFLQRPCLAHTHTHCCSSSASFHYRLRTASYLLLVCVFTAQAIP